MYIKSFLVNTNKNLLGRTFVVVSFCIKTNNEQIQNYLMDNIALINLSDIIFVKKFFSKYTNIIVHYVGTDTNLFYEYFANILTGCIINNFEYKIVHKLLEFNYFYFDDMDLSKIETNCTEILNSLSNTTAIDVSSYLPIEILDRENCVFESVCDYIKNHKSMVLDGFVRFRLFQYINILDSFVDFCVNQFILNREYTEFIDLLKLYINSKETKTKLVHLIYVNDESILLDENKNIISLSHSNLDTHYLSDISFSSNDYALNTLLSLLPEKIIIHLVSPENEFINTLRLIFDGKVVICSDCNICRTYKILSNSKIT
jgi:sporulation protein ytxC